MSFFRSIFTFPSRSDWTSWHALWRIIPLFIGLVIFTGNAASEKVAASRQQRSFGTITDCHDGSKGSRSCHYTFFANDQQYSGLDSVDLGVYFGQTKIVYFDPQDPTVNALHDFSDTGNRDSYIAYGLGFVIAVLVAIVLYVNLLRHVDPNQRLA